MQATLSTTVEQMMTAGNPKIVHFRSRPAMLRAVQALFELSGADAFAQAGIDFGARLFADPTTEYFRILEVMRDYGMYERGEAPQYYPPVERR